MPGSSPGCYAQCLPPPPDSPTPRPAVRPGQDKRKGKQYVSMVEALTSKLGNGPLQTRVTRVEVDFCQQVREPHPHRRIQGGVLGVSTSRVLLSQVCPVLVPEVVIQRYPFRFPRTFGQCECGDVLAAPLVSPLLRRRAIKSGRAWTRWSGARRI